MESLSKSKALMLQMVIFVIACILVANAGEHNGRLKMCNEVGGSYLSDNSCMNVTKLDNGINVDGKIRKVENKQFSYDFQENVD